MKSSKGSSRKYVLDDQGRPLACGASGGQTLRITQDILDDIRSQRGSLHPVDSCLNILSREFIEFQPRPEIALSVDLKDRAHHYYVTGPSATFEGFLLERAWLSSIENYVCRALQWKVRFHFETIDPYCVPRWHVSYMPEEEST